MSLLRSPSLSEGEIDSGDGEKVTKNASSQSRTSINSSTRHESSSRTSRFVSRRAMLNDRNAHFDGAYSSAAGRDRDRSRSPFRKERSGSRSPFRADRDGGGRDKRRRDDDHYGKGASDPRRHKVYEDPQPRHGSYRDPDRPTQPSKDLSYSEKRSQGPRASQSNRDRDRSRSPYKASAANAHTRPSSKNGPTSQAYAGSESGERRRGSAHSINRESSPQASREQVDAKPKTTQSEQRRGNPASVAEESEQTTESAEPQQQLSEAELIEQRRKKREAIRKKHAATSANDSLLRATLESNLPSTATTPYNESSGNGSAPQSPPSSINSPRTPMDTSSPGSPADTAAINDEDLVNPIQLNGTADEQGQSAADYDPNQDMDEDRPDHKRQDLQEDHHEADTKPAPPTKKVANDFDMFADEDEDEDDMFAAEDKPAAGTSTKHARALDESLLDNWDYPDGHYRIIHGELLDGRYAVKQQIGKGTFATVVRAQDTKTGNNVAIKIACQNDTMLKAGQKEMQFLQKLNESDPDDKKYIIRLLSDFTHKGHLCLVFEGLEMDLRETLKKFGRDVGINPEAIQIYARQMFFALLHMKNMEVLHADLKPDNILVSSDNKFIKIIDFGTATFQQDAELTPYLVSRFYRAPEVILGMDFDYAIDMWSIGCTLYELYTGRILFNGSDNNNMLRVIQECRGKLPNRLVKRAQLADNYFDEAFVFHGLERDKMTGNMVQRAMHFGQGIAGKDLKSRLSANSKKMDTTQLKLHNAFVDLLDKCLQLDPEKRIKPKDALRHPFVSEMKRDTLAQGKSKVSIAAATSAKIFRPTVVQRSG